MNVTIIYNPKSTGDSKKNAVKLQKEIKQDKTILVPTKNAGHAEEIAYDLAKQKKPMIIVASSGDGGYHEVINGIIRAGNKKIIAGTIPSGNANDHHRNAYKQPVAESINKRQFKKIDLIHLTAEHKGSIVLDKYAHSYIGIGVSAEVAQAINLGAKSLITEKLAGIKTFFNFKSFKIQIGNKKIRVDSLMANNIPEMAKTLTVADNISPNDGCFGLTLHEHKTRINLLNFFATAHFKQVSATCEKELVFTMLSSVPVQMDGEVYKLKPGYKVTIKNVAKSLTTFS